MSSNVWKLIYGFGGVFLGGMLSFLLESWREKKKENIERENYLKDLLADLKFNKKLADKGKVYGYHTLGYKDAKGAKYLHELPENLRSKIYDAHVIMFKLNQRSFSEGDKKEEVDNLKPLLDDAVSQLDKFINNRTWKEKLLHYFKG